MASIQIRNIIKNCERINESAFRIAQLSGTSQIRLVNEQVRILHAYILNLQTAIEKKTKAKGGTPADLPNPSFRAYQWIRFLSQKKWLLIHLHALSEFVVMMHGIRLLKERRVHPGHIHLSIRNSSYLFRSQRKGKEFFIEINEGFVSAPKEIKEAIIRAALGDRKKTTGRMIRKYTKSAKYQQIMNVLKTVEQPNRLSAQGNLYDLQKLYARINAEYFQGALAQPRLIWSTRRSKRRFGMYDPESHTITINRILDSKKVPLIALEYILFHEMLHQKLGVVEQNGRRYAHTPAFKKAEGQFKGKPAADAAIRKLTQS
jgi:predicted metal-dependent hydrolase